MDTPYQGVGALLVEVGRLLRRNFNRRAQELGLTQAQWQALAHLSRKQGINQACLADLLEVQPITLARLIDRLAAAGWVERRPDPADRRAQRLYLTTGPSRCSTTCGGSPARPARRRWPGSATPSAAS